MSDAIIAIQSFSYNGPLRCMGYPVELAGHRTAEMWFDSPQVMKDQVPNCPDRVYLCGECWTWFIEAIAIGVVYWK